MKKNIFLFHRFDKHAIDHFKIKNAILRNKNIFVETRGYISEATWTEFVKAFINANNRWITENNLVIDYDFTGFILMYDDVLLEKRIIITDYDTILETLSN